MINNPLLKSTYDQLSTIEHCLEKDFKHVRTNKAYLDNLVPQNLRGVHSKKMDDACKFIDTVSTAAYESGVVILIATFESIAFDKYKNTYGNLKAVVKNNSSKPLSFYSAREKLVNDSYDKLSAILKLIDGHITMSLHANLEIIKNYRDYLAHGKRFSAPPSTKFTLYEIAKILDEVLLEIEN